MGGLIEARQSVGADPQRTNRLFDLAVVAGIVLVLVVMRWGTFTTPPAWDAAMSVWPAAIEISSDWDLGRVLALPTYVQGGPNTHTLSLVTLAGALSITFLGPEATYALFHAIGIALAAGMGALVGYLLRLLNHQSLAPWGAAATALFPLVMSQTAYLYTELPSAFLVVLAAVMFARDRRGLAFMSLLSAVLVKALAVTAVPAMMFFAWRRRRQIGSLVWPALSVLGVVPALLVPQSNAALDFWERLRVATDLSWEYFSRSPELIVLFAAVPVVAALVFRRAGASKDEWLWLAVFTIFIGTFGSFFALNGVLTAGFFFLPRYALYLVPFAMLVTFFVIARLRGRSIRTVVVTALLWLLVLGARGPFAWGGDSPVHPLAERSLAFVERVNEQVAGLARLAELSLQMPVVYDHQAHYGYMYRDLGHFDGALQDGIAVYLARDWGENMSQLPDRFAMLVAFPMLGGERMRFVEMKVAADPSYQVSKETIGLAEAFPLEIIIVERTDQDAD
jgi:hypothetical protein